MAFSKKAVAAAMRADKATADMVIRPMECGGKDCPNPVSVKVGDKMFCESCLKTVSLSYPSSYKAYWEPKLVRMQ